MHSTGLLHPICNEQDTCSFWYFNAAIVGRLGAAPLGAVGLSNLVFFFCQAFFGFLLIVTTPRVANAVAGGDDAEVFPHEECDRLKGG